MTSGTETIQASDPPTFSDTALQLQLLQDSNVNDDDDLEDEDIEYSDDGESDDEDEWLELLARETYSTVDGVPSCQMPLCPLARYEETLYCRFCGTNIDILWQKRMRQKYQAAHGNYEIRTPPPKWMAAIRMLYEQYKQQKLWVFDTELTRVEVSPGKLALLEEIAIQRMDGTSVVDAVIDWGLSNQELAEMINPPAPAGTVRSPIFKRSEGCASKSILAQLLS